MPKVFRLTQTILPIAGSIGFLYYLNQNDKFRININLGKDRTNEITDLVNQLQRTPNTILSHDTSVVKKFGPNINSHIDGKDTAMMFLNYYDPNVKNTKFTMKLRRPNEQTDLAEVIVDLELIRKKLFYFIPVIYSNIKTMDMNVVNAIEKKMIRMAEKLDLPLDTATENAATNLKFISSTHLITDSSEYFSVVLPTDMDQLDSLHVATIRCLIEDKAKLNKLGPPLKIQQLNIKKDVPYFSEYMDRARFIIKGTKEIASVIILTKRGDITNTHATLVHVTKPNLLDTYADVSSLHTFDLILQNRYNHRRLTQVFADIDLNKVIEDKLLRKSRKIDSIGRPFKLKISPEQIEHLFEGTGEQTIRIDVFGKLNKGQLIMHIARKNEHERWQMKKSDVKILWNDSGVSN